MSSISKEIDIHENNIKDLKDKINQTRDGNEKLLINEKIIIEQQFLLSLYKIKDGENESKSKSQQPKKSKIHLKNEENPENIKDKKNNNNRNIKVQNKNFNNIEKELSIPIENSKKKSFTFESEDLNIITKYYKKLEKQNITYFECSKRRSGCEGKIKFDKKNKKWILTNICDTKIEHDIIKFDNFFKDYKDNNLKKYNMEYRKYQEYFVKCCFKNNDIIQNIDIYKRFKEKFNLDINLTNNEISKLKNQIIGKYNKMDLHEFYSEIEFDKDLEFKIYTSDIIYEIKHNNLI